MNRIILLLLTSFTMVAFPAMVQAGFFDDLVKEVDRQLDKQAEEEPELELDSELDGLAAENCPEDRKYASKKLSLLDTGKAEIKRQAINKTMKSLDLEGTELPKPITSICTAEKRYTYIVKANDRWAERLLVTMEKATESLGLDYEIEAARLFQEGKQFSDLNRSEKADLQREVEGTMTLIEQSIQEKTIQSKELLLEASASMRSATLDGSHIGAWEKRLAEFMSANINWATDDLERLEVFSDSVVFLGKTLESMRQVSAAYNAYNREGINSNRYERILEKDQAEDIAYQEKLAAEIEL